MATVSSLTKGVRRTGERNKSHLQWSSPDSNLNFRSRKGNNNQGDSDSDPTSSMHDSTSTSTPSTDRYMEEPTRRKKTLDKSNSKKRTGFWSFRASKSIPQSPSLSLPEVNSATTRHPSPVKVSDASTTRKSSQKISRSGSLRSLKIVRNKSRKSTESKGQYLRSNRATFSSTLKDSKFPEQVESQVSEKESEEILPVAKVCPYQHCSLHGHHHHHEPPVKRFSFLKRRSSKDQKGVNPKIPVAVDNPYSKKTEVKVIKKGGSNVGSKSKKNEKEIKKDVDCSIEFYAKTRTEHVQSSSGLYDEDLADIMFDVNGSNQKEVIDDQGPKNDDSDGFADVKAKKQSSVNGNQFSMWRLIQRHMGSGSDLVAKLGSELDQQLDNEKQSCNVDDAVNQETENPKTFVIKIVREAIQKILLSEVHQSTPIGAFPEQDNSERVDQKKQNPGTNDMPDTRWSYKKKAMLLKRFITELEKVKKLDFNTCRLLPLVPESEAETVSLRPQKIGDKKNSDDWMLDYAIQQAVCELSPSQKRKVGLLVKAFESVAPKLNDLEESGLNEENGDYKDFDEKGIEEFDQKMNSKIDYEMKSEKEKYMKMWHMIYQHVVTDITSKVGSELLNDGDDEQEVKDQNIDKEFSPKDADILIRQSVNEILLPEVQEDASLDKKEDDGGETQTQLVPKNWNKLRTLRRSIKDLESFRKPKPEQEGGQVDLRRQMSREKTKAEQWMIDYAVQHIVTKLTPARKKRVSMLVEAFEAVIPLPET